VSCHGPQGKGDGPAGKYLNPRPNDFAVSLKDKTDEWIAKSIKGGGAAVGLSKVMPPYADLSDDQVKALVEYIKKLGS
jgi:mono/diheme cytochrome c family protein